MSVTLGVLLCSAQHEANANARLSPPLPQARVSGAASLAARPSWHPAATRWPLGRMEKSSPGCAAAVLGRAVWAAAA